MLPAALQAVPWSQSPAAVAVAPLQVTLPAPVPPQQARVLSQASPVRRHPPADWQTVAPEPGSSQIREQQLDPLAHGSPPWAQPPAPLPAVAMQKPAPPSVLLQVALQQSEPR